MKKLLILLFILCITNTYCFSEEEIKSAKSDMNKDCVKVIYEGRNSYGLKNFCTEEILIPPTYNYVESIKNTNIYKVEKKEKGKSSKWGMYDASKREFILPVEYDGIYEKEGITKKYGMYIVRKGTKYGVFSTKECSMIAPVEINNSEALNYVLKMLIILR